MMFLLAFVLIFSSYLILSFFWPLISGGAGWSPTPKKDIIQALELCNLSKNDTFFDLGCGFGSVLVEASKLCPNIIGIEIEPLKWFISRLRVPKAKIILGDMFKQDISKADVIFLFQFKGFINLRIGRKILNEARQHIKVISYLYQIEGLNLILEKNGIYIYEVVRSEK